MGSWVPAMGEIVGFMASTPARGGYNTINHRTYVKAFVFPYLSLASPDEDTKRGEPSRARPFRFPGAGVETPASP